MKTNNSCSDLSLSQSGHISFVAFFLETIWPGTWLINYSDQHRLQAQIMLKLV